MPSDFSTDLAVVIGINDYAGTVGRLETPVRDAEAVAQALESRFGYEVILRRDDEATRERLLDLLNNELPHRVREGSRLLFYFAGHGVAQDSEELEGPRGFLVPQDATPDVATQLAMTDVHEALAGLPCRHLLVVLDCCFSGSFHWEGRRPLHVPGELLYQERYLHWVRHPARWVLASAAHDEYALDIADRRRGQVGSHSPFATALLDGLAGAADCFPKGGDGVITLAELYAYVRDRLTPHQSPVLAPLRGQTRGEFVFRDPSEPLGLKSAEIEVALDDDANPYRGLEPYKAEHVALFFGRGEATRLLRSHVETHPLTVVVGPSGSGKSSLVHAGLLPGLRREADPLWIAPPPFRVTGGPFAALRDALMAAGGPPALEADLRDPRDAEAWAASWTAAHPSIRLLLVIDQAEELITRVTRSGSEEPPESLPDESAQFLACLAALIQGGGGRVRAVVVVRSDYETDLDDGPHASLWKDGRFIVPPLRREDLREIIEGPAASKALYFDDPRLVDRLVDEVWGMPGGLPLLSYALSRLYLAYVKHSRGDRLLTAMDLEAIGGEPGDEGEDAVAPGAIVRILRDGADKAVKSLPDGEHRKTLWRVLLRMVHLVGARTTRRQVPEDELVYPTEEENRRIEAVRERFVDKARLLVSSEEGGRDLIEPAHDELLVAWPELVRRIDEARVHLPVHRRLTEAAVEWSAPAPQDSEGRRRTPDLDLRLLGLVETSGLPEDWLNKAETDYVTAARRARRNRTALRWTAAVVILLVTTGAALFFRYQSQRNERLAYQSAIQGLVNQGEADLSGGQPTRALLLARQAFDFLTRSRGTGATRIDRAVSRSLDLLLSRSAETELTARVDRLFRQLLDDLPPNRVVLRNQVDDDPVPLAFHPSGRLLAAGHDRSLVLVTLPPDGVEGTGLPYPVPGAPEEALAKVAFSSDGRFLAAGYAAGSLCVWRVAGPPSAPALGAFACAPKAAGGVSGLAFRPGTSTLVVGREGEEGTGSIQVWKVAGDPGRAPRLDLLSNQLAPGKIDALVVSAAGEMFVAVTPSQILRRSVEHPTAFRRMENPEKDTIQFLGLDMSDLFLVGITTGGQVFVWELPSGNRLARIFQEQAAVGAFASSNGGLHPSEHDPLLIVNYDRQIDKVGRVPGENSIPSLCQGHATELAVVLGGRRIAVACDGVLRLWDLQPVFDVWTRGIGRQNTSPSGVVTFLAPGGPGPQLAVSKETGSVDLYDLGNGKQWSSPISLFAGLEPCRGTAKSSVAWRSDDKSLYMLGKDGRWRERPAIQGGCVCAAAGSADDAWLALLLAKSPGETDLIVVPMTSDEEPQVLTSRLTTADWCDIGLAFHPTRTELATGIWREITLWAPSSKGPWQSRQLGRSGGRITAAIWAEDLLAVGGEILVNDNGFIEIFDPQGNLRQGWSLRQAPVNGLAFEPEKRLLAVSTDGGGLQIWDLDTPVRLVTLGGEGIGSPVFLESMRIAARTGNGVSLWNLDTKALADAACATVPSNLPMEDWTTYVDADLARYELTCPGQEIGPHPTLLDYADTLASEGDLEGAQSFYQLINKLSAKIVVKNPAQRARGQQLYQELSEPNVAPQPHEALEQAKEYNALRSEERLPSLSLKTLSQLCRQAVLLGEPRNALEFCDGALELLRDGDVLDARGLARALLGDHNGARADFVAARDWSEDPDWRSQHQSWIDACDAGQPPLLEIFRQIAHKELRSR